MILVASLRAPSVGIDLAGHYAKDSNKLLFIAGRIFQNFQLFQHMRLGIVIIAKFFR